MTRVDLIKAVALDNPNLSVEQVDALVSAFFEVIVERLASGGRVELRRFGTFETRNRGARAGFNPRTGELIDVEARRIPFFRPGKKWSNWVGAETRN